MRRALWIAAVVTQLMLVAGPGRSLVLPAASGLATWRAAHPEVVLAGVPFALTISDTTAGAPAELTVEVAGGIWRLTGQVREGEPPQLAQPLPGAISLVGGRHEWPQVVVDGPAARLELADPRQPAQRVLVEPRVLPGWLSIGPPLLAIVLALLSRQVVVALICGVWLGAWMIYDWNPLLAFLRLGDRFLVTALADRDHASIVIFSSLLGGMVGILSRSGATEGIVRMLAGRVGGRRGGQTATAAMGTLIFFDDYANTLLVGSTMRPLTDRLKISREKLAYLVDSTAAPVASIAVISTWVGFEVGLIQEAMALQGGGDSAYTFFLRTIPYGFYPILTLVCVYLVATLGRDFGPMWAAETRAIKLGQVLRPGAQPASDTGDFQSGGQPREAAHPLLAGLPVLLVIGVTAVGLWWDGWQKLRLAGVAQPTLQEILNEADSFAVLMWAAMCGALCAGLLAWLRRRLSLRETLEAWLAGVKSMLIAFVILLLAWSLSAVCSTLHTADFLVEICRGSLAARFLPVLTFVLAAGISFATGTSWGTMAILMPLIYPLGAILPGSEGIAAEIGVRIHLASVGAVLAGAVFGDHCSPISDTTIMSSLASGSDHIDHVRTQLPYAALVAIVAVLCGYLPVGFGLPAGTGLIAGASLILLVLLWRGRRRGG